MKRSEGRWALVYIVLGLGLLIPLVLIGWLVLFAVTPRGL
jgi:hypothetical protein